MSELKTSRPASATGSAKADAPTNFNGDLLRPYTRKLLESTLTGVVFEKEKLKSCGKEIARRIKDRMCEIAPRGWKFIVTVSINENCNQGGRADMATHWGEDDTVVQEMYSNEHLLVFCIAYAIKTDR